MRPYLYYFDIRLLFGVLVGSIVTRFLGGCYSVLPVPATAAGSAHNTSRVVFWSSGSSACLEYVKSLYLNHLIEEGEKNAHRRAVPRECLRLKILFSNVLQFRSASPCYPSSSYSFSRFTSLLRPSPYPPCISRLIPPSVLRNNRLCSPSTSYRLNLWIDIQSENEWLETKVRGLKKVEKEVTELFLKTYRFLLSFILKLIVLVPYVDDSTKRFRLKYCSDRLSVT